MRQYLKRGVSLLLCFCMPLSALFAGPALKAEAAGEITLPAAQDAFVSNFSGQGNSLGTSLNAAKLIYGKSRHVYLKFDLSSMDTDNYDIDEMNMTLSFRKSHSSNELVFTEAESVLRASSTEWTVTNVTYNNRPDEIAGSPVVTQNVLTTGEQDLTVDLSPIFRNALHSGRQIVSIHLTTTKVDDSTVSASEMYSSRNTSGYAGPSLHIELGERILNDGTDRTALQALIAQAKLLLETDYTDESWAELVSALQIAQGIMLNTASQLEADQAVLSLQTALDNLKDAELPVQITGPDMGNYYNNSKTAAMIMRMKTGSGEYVKVDPETEKLSLTANAAEASSFALYVLDYFATVDHEEAEAGATRTAYSIQSLDNHKYLTIQNYFTAEEFLNNTHRYYNILSGASSGTSTSRTFEIKAAAAVPGWNERFYVDQYPNSGFYRIWSHLSTMRDDSNFNRFNVKMTSEAMVSSGIASENTEYKFYFEQITDRDLLEVSQEVSGAEAGLFWKPVNGDTDPAHYKVSGTVTEAVYSGGLMHLTIPDLSVGVHSFTVEYSGSGYQTEVEVNVRIFNHPGILLTLEDLEEMKAHVQAKEEPWYSDYQRLLDTVSYNVAGSGYVTTVFTNVGRGGAPSDSGNIGYFEKGGSAAYFNALQWVITGDEQYAAKAADILSQWAATLKVIDGRDRILGAGINAYKYASAAEILRYYSGGYNGYSDADFKALQGMMLNVVYPVIQDAAVPMIANGNWDAAALVSMMAIGVLCDQTEIFDRAMHFYQDIHTNGSIFAYVNDSGQTMETGRDQTHAMLALGYMSEICLIAKNQQEDLYSLYGNRLAKAFEYTAKYNLYSQELYGEAVPFVAMPNVFGDTSRGYYGDGFDRDSNGLNRGEFRPVFEQALALYSGEEGVDLTWTERAAAAMRPQGMVHFDNLNFGTLTYYDGEPLDVADGPYFQLRTRWEPLYQRNWSTVNGLKTAETLNSYYDINGNGELVTSVMKQDAPYYQLITNNDGTYSVLLLKTNTYLSVKDDQAGDYNVIKADAVEIGENEKFALMSSGVGPFYLVSPKFDHRIVVQEAAGSGSDAVLTLRLGTKTLPEITDTSNVSTNERLIFMYNTQEIALGGIAALQPSIKTVSLAEGKVGIAYNETLAATGDGTILWSVQAGELPSGLSLSAAGVISGTPVRAGTYTFTVAADNAAGGDTKDLSLVIAPKAVSASTGSGTATVTPTPTPTPVQEEVAHNAALNGAAVELTRAPDGSYSLVSTGEQIREALGNSGELVITVKDVTDLNVELPVTAMGTAALTVRTDFGTVTLSGATLQNIMKLYGATLKLHISKGSYSIGLLVDGRAAAYDSADYPLIITLPFQPVEGQDASAYVVIRKTEGTDRILPLAAGINGSVTFTASATGTYDVVYNGYTFGDVPDSYWAAQDIAFVAARGLLTGTDSSLFSPGASMTRAMFVQALANLEGIDGSSYTGTPFTDVPEGKWYTAAVNWAVQTGIVNGTGQGRFSPDGRITREQMAAMLYTYVESKGYTLPAVTAANFTDGGQIRPWAREAADRLAAAGILAGEPGDKLNPGMGATRAEVAAVFARFIRAVSSN